MRRINYVRNKESCLMVRTTWKGALVILLAWAGTAVAQQLPSSSYSTDGDVYLFVDEPGKPRQK